MQKAIGHTPSTSWRLFKKKKLKQVDSLGVSNPVLLTVHKIRNMHYAINK